MPSGGRRLPPWTSPRSAEVSRWSPCTPAAAAAGSGHVTPASGCSRPPRVPSVESPYVRAKQAQLVEKDPNKAIPLFWAAINSGDRIESALKDMATVLKQANRTEEAIEAIRSFRHCCPGEAQESLDNILLDLYKKCGRTEEQIEMLTVKLRIVDEELVSGRWKTKLSRSQGRTTYVSLKDEKARLLGNLAWAYMQSENYEEAEMLYRQALVIEADYNKECNLAICLMKTGKIAKARCLLEAIPCSNSSDESHVKSFARATEMLIELESQALPSPVTQLKCKEPWVLLAADVKKLEELEPPTLYTPMTQLKHKEPQISVAADEENHRNFNSGALPSPVTQLKRKEQQILIASGGEKHKDCDDEYSDFSRFFNDAATPQSILEKLRKRLVKEEIPNADGTAVASSWNPMQGEVPSANVVRKTWADMVEEEEQQSHHSNSTVGVTYIEQKESSKHTSEQKYRTPSDSSKESSTLQRPTTGCMLSSSSAGLWRHNDSKIFSEKRRTWADMVEEEQQMDESSKHESEHKYRTPSASSHESSTLQRTIAGPRPPSYSAGSWRHNETRIFTDENVNWKFVRSTPMWKQQKWQDHSNRVCQRLNTIRLNEKPQDTFRAPWRNGTAQRSLFSDWKSNSDGSGSASMPFGKKEHCQGSSYIEATNSWPNHVPSMRPWRSQNRLRVFQEITNDVKRSAV